MAKHANQQNRVCRRTFVKQLEDAGVIGFWTEMAVGV